MELKYKTKLDNWSQPKSFNRTFMELKSAKMDDAEGAVLVF